jgi:exodeoxyribonuclease-5
MKTCMGIQRLGSVRIHCWHFRLYRFGCLIIFTESHISTIIALRYWPIHVTTPNLTIGALIEEARPIFERYRDQKRASAQLDFDDLVFAARDLLRDHDDVRHALGQRFAHVLVDEFQDTDPLQTEIFWRLCGDPAGNDSDWTRFRIRPGALFLVGDPKQAVYRFRGADVGAYLQARDAFRGQDPDSLLSISTNFRSFASILTFVNERFEAVLSADGQPGFTALDPFHQDRGDALCVAALDIAVADENGKASAEQQRDGEADASAELCARLFGVFRRGKVESRLTC